MTKQSITNKGLTRLPAGRLGLDSRQGQGIFILATASRPALDSTQSPIQWVLGALSPGVKRPLLEANHSSRSSAEVKNAWSYTSIHPNVFMAWCLVKHRDNLCMCFFYASSVSSSHFQFAKLMCMDYLKKSHFLSKQHPTN
jgi:hypothetical protein